MVTVQNSSKRCRDLQVYQSLLTLLAISLLATVPACTDSEEAEEARHTISWTLEQVDAVGGHQPQILGTPRVVSDVYGPSLAFNGVSDGLIVPVNPVKGWDVFSVEVLFKPDSDGPEEQRFVHFQDEDDNRGLIETRVTPDGSWALDTFLYNSETDTGLTLLDRDLLHAGDEWYWAAMVFDGTTLKHYVFK